MPQSRKYIRDAVVALLSGNTVAGTNVFGNRETSLWETELPAILVYTKDETANPRSLNSKQSIRTLDLVVEIKALATESVDNTLDAIAEVVETLLLADQSLTGTSISIEYQSTSISLDTDSETEKGVAALTFQVKYIK